MHYLESTKHMALLESLLFLHLMSCESSNIGAARQPDDISQVTRSHHNELYFELCQGPITTTTLVNRIPCNKISMALH